MRSSTSAVLIDQAVVSGGNFLTSLVLARLLLPAEYGIFSLIYLAILSVNTCHSSLVVYPLTLRGASGDRKELSLLTRAALVHTALLSLPLAAAVSIIATVLHHSELIPVLFVAMLFWQLQETVRRALLAAQRAGSAILPDAICYLGQGIVLLLLKPHSFAQIFLVVAITSATAMVWQCSLLEVQLRHAGWHKTALDHGRYAWQMGRYILSANALNMVSLQVPGWVLAFSAGAASTGGYQSLLNLAGVANPIIFSINSLLIPLVARNAAQGSTATRRIALRYGSLYGSLLLPFLIAFAAAPAFMIRLVYGAQTPYAQYAGLLPPFVLAFGLQYVATVVGAYEGGMSRPRTYMQVQVLSTVALITVGIPMIVYLKLAGAVWAFFIASAVRLVVFLFLSIRNDRSASHLHKPKAHASGNDLPSLRVQVCILTYQRSEMLAAALESLARQTITRMDNVIFTILVVDNDAEGSDREVVEAFAGKGTVDTSYCLHPPNGLSAGRNLALARSSAADFVLFLDDDEVASPDWAEHLLKAAYEHNAEVVTGPVLPMHAASPAWVEEGKFFDPKRFPTGTLLQHVASNNTLLSKKVFTTFLFDRAYDFSGGEDTDFFLRVGAAGHRMVWCDEAMVSESVPASRANLKWILRRARSDASRYTSAYVNLHRGLKASLVRVLRALAGAAMGIVLLPTGLIGKQYAVKGLVLIARASGSLSALFGREQSFYGAPAKPEATEPLKVVVVGQVPPPVNGQSIMIEELLKGKYRDLELIHVPMHFSRTTGEIGRFELHKLLSLVQTLLQIIRVRFTSKATVLYYPPAGANLTPVLRDLFLLSLTRPLFSTTVFHFHATGLTNIVPRLPALLRSLFRHAYEKPDLSIFTTKATSADGALLHSKAIAVVACGSADHTMKKSFHKPSTATPKILFVGILCEGKGVMIMLKACKILLSHGVPFHLQLMGAFQSPAFEKSVMAYVRQEGMEQVVEFLGVRTGTAKETVFERASIFCFPSHYPAESFGVVLIEAMSYKLPIVATRWQGIPEVAGEDGQGALLVPARDFVQLAESLALLLQSSELRESMGAHNRQRYEERFTLDRYRDNLSSALLSVRGKQAFNASNANHAGIVKRSYLLSKADARD